MLATLGFRWRSFWRQLTGWRVVTPEEIEGVLRLPVLAIIPHLERRLTPVQRLGPVKRHIDLEGRWRSRLLIHFPLDSPAAAAYASLVDELAAGSRLHGRKTLLCISSVAGEGTSLTCTNLAIAGKRHNVKVLVVEGHTRAPRISSVLNLELEPGLTGCLHRSLPVARVIQKSGVAGVDVLAAGRPVAYPEALWGTPAFQRLLAEMRSLYDLVFFEGGAALLYQDTPVLAEKLDRILLIHQFGRTSSERIQKAIEKLGPQKEKILGVVLNDTPYRACVNARYGPPR